ncbi:MAG: DUF4363 family protein [Ruminococcus sp.]|nr:DUF4363 family protein [Ruminococcus sp.]
MKRVRLGIAILLILILTSIGTAWYVRHTTQTLLKALDNLAEIAENLSVEEAIPAFQAFEANWEKVDDFLSFMVWKDRVLQVDITISHLRPMLESNCDELKSELSEAKMLLERFGKNELPTFWNIL